MSTTALPLPPLLKSFGGPRPTWTAVAAMMLSVMLPVSGWMVSLANRVAVLEAENSHLSTAAVQIAALTQELKDFRLQYDQDRINDRVVNSRLSRP